MKSLYICGSLGRTPDGIFEDFQDAVLCLVRNHTAAKDDLSKIVWHLEFVDGDSETIRDVAQHGNPWMRWTWDPPDDDALCYIERREINSETE